MTTEITPIVTVKRQYPHVDQIGDWPAQQSIRLLWERIFSLQEQLTAAQATIATLVDTANAADVRVTATQQAANEALALSQQLGQVAGTPVGGPGTAPDIGGDTGGDEGCAAAGPTGHDSGGPLSSIRAGQIACGTTNEWAALKNPAPDLATRQAQAEELLRRMIWHLHEAGFTAGRQQNPSGAISKDKLCVEVNGVVRAYDVFIDYDNHLTPLRTHMGEVTPAHLIDDAGIPD